MLYFFILDCHLRAPAVNALWQKRTAAEMVIPNNYSDIIERKAKCRLHRILVNTHYDFRREGSTVHVLLYLFLVSDNWSVSPGNHLFLVTFCLSFYDL
jgi:hypothetical protein